MKSHGFIKDSNGKYSLVRGISDNDILAAAREIIGRRYRRGTVINSPKDSADYLISQLAHLEHEVFYVIFLDNKHHIIASETMFTGTIDGASVYPRECVKRALQLNSVACIISHNHPSGSCDPSIADRSITEKLKSAFSLVDIRMLDHIIVAGTSTYSFAECGLL